MLSMPDRRPLAPHGEVCDRCRQTPGHAADVAAFEVGFSWAVRDPLPGLARPVWVCAACIRGEAHDVYADNRRWYAGHGATDAQIAALLAVPA
jgi:hypothetical protein